MELIHISTIARNATIAGIASATAGLQDRGWQYADTFVRNFEAFDQSVGDEELLEVAESVPGLEVEEWEADLDDEAAQDVIDADAQLAIDLGLDDEPAVQVSGPGGEELLDDSPSGEEIEAAIAAAG
jgi:predicted DsbA family dithiol-disulfide isomerase